MTFDWAHAVNLPRQHVAEIVAGHVGNTGEQALTQMFHPSRRFAGIALPAGASSADLTKSS